MDELSEAQLETAAADLRRRRVELSALMAAHAGESRPVELDQGRLGRLSRMDALQVQAMAAATNGRRQQEVIRIDAALERLARGEFGDCLDCGEPIASKRLLNDPSTPLCIACASRVQ